MHMLAFGANNASKSKNGQFNHSRRVDAWHLAFLSLLGHLDKSRAHPSSGYTESSNAKLHIHQVAVFSDGEPELRTELRWDSGNYICMKVSM